MNVIMMKVFTQQKIIMKKNLMTIHSKEHLEHPLIMENTKLTQINLLKVLLLILLIKNLLQLEEHIEMLHHSKNKNTF